MELRYGVVRDAIDKLGNSDKIKHYFVKPQLVLH